MEGSSNFIELDWAELTEDIHNLVASHAKVKIWEKGDLPDLCEVVNSHSNEEGEEFCQQLRLRLGKVDDSWKTKDLFMQFSLGGLDYFTKGKVVEVLGNEDFWFEMNPHVFKMEKRGDERLLTYPNFQVYAYFKIQKQVNTQNLIFINKHVEDNHKAFKKFQELSNEEILEAQDRVESDQEDELIGFRALDLSSSGIAFLVNEKEKAYFSNDIGELNITLLFDKDVFKLSSAKMVYNVDYVNPRMGNLPMAKIGFTFSDNPELTKLIDQKIKESGGDEAHKDFENFVD
ncbi:MAG: hypothetical protein EP326_15420 [Deltaproteobacteria bacterium]|jgi:hypothetical protein|nr:MAG: hypothetical protein EP326_15420 [Deltaproteobacteria bacterium]TNF31599.1 MAG: hypothetical protein EP319_01725 [Deltaproteobacteria bacterium]